MRSYVRSTQFIFVFAALGCGDDAAGTGGAGGESAGQTATTIATTTTTTIATTTSTTGASSGTTTGGMGGGMSCFGEVYISEIGPGIACGQLFTSSDWMEGPVSVKYEPPAIALTYGPFTFTGTVADDGTFYTTFVHDESLQGDPCSPWEVYETLAGSIDLDSCTIDATYTYHETPELQDDYCMQITCPDETAPVTISPEGSACAGVFTGPSPGPDCLSCMKQSCCDLVAACGEASTCVDCYVGDTSACSPEASQAADALAACADANCQAVCEVTPFPADCEASLPAASGGSCMPPLDSTFQCNLFTNEGCTANEVCGMGNGTTECYPLAPVPTELCEPCDGECGTGMVCIGTSDPGSARCAAFCCSDSDCGAGAQCSLGLGMVFLNQPISFCMD